MRIKLWICVYMWFERWYEYGLVLTLMRVFRTVLNEGIGYTSQHVDSPLLISFVSHNTVESLLIKNHQAFISKVRLVSLFRSHHALNPLWALRQRLNRLDSRGLDFLIRNPVETRWTHSIFLTNEGAENASWRMTCKACPQMWRCWKTGDGVL